jgi:hypothetical protein
VKFHSWTKEMREVSLLDQRDTWSFSFRSKGYVKFYSWTKEVREVSLLDQRGT